VKPIGPLNHKVSLSVPLSMTFWSYYCNLATMDVTVLRSAAREIGSRSTANVILFPFTIIRYATRQPAPKRRSDYASLHMATRR